MPGRLTTHVLDTANGKPAAGMAIELARLGPGGERIMVVHTMTNADGRTDAPLLSDGNLEAGVYELTFATGEYWARTAAEISDPPFLDVVPIRFGISDPDAHYHVPLLCSPWAYSTYRGS